MNFTWYILQAHFIYVTVLTPLFSIGRNSPFGTGICFYFEGKELQKWNVTSRRYSCWPPNRCQSLDIKASISLLKIRWPYTLYIKQGAVSLRRLVEILLALHIGERGRTQSENKYFPTKRWWRLSIKYDRDYFTSKASDGDRIDNLGNYLLMALTWNVCVTKQELWNWSKSRTECDGCILSYHVHVRIYSRQTLNDFSEDQTLRYLMTFSF